MKATTKRRIRILLLVIFFSTAAVVMQFGFLNLGQKFGTYGQYNRILAVIREMDGYQVVDSRLSRRLDWRNVGHLDSFSVRIRNTQGRLGAVEFLRGSPEMREQDPDILKRIIEEKFGLQARSQ